MDVYPSWCDDAAEVFVKQPDLDRLGGDTSPGRNMILRKLFELLSNVAVSEAGSFCFLLRLFLSHTSPLCSSKSDLRCSCHNWFLGWRLLARSVLYLIRHRIGLILQFPSLAE